MTFHAYFPATPVESARICAGEQPVMNRAQSVSTCACGAMGTFTSHCGRPSTPVSGPRS